MNITQFVRYLAKYSLPTVIMAIMVTAFTGLIKVYVFKGEKRKLTTVLPFLLGIIFETVYRLIFGGELIFDEILTGGTTTGGLSTVIYVFYAQFLKYGTVENISLENLTVESLLGGYVGSNNIKGYAEKVVEIYKSSDSEELFLESMKELFGGEEKESAKNKQTQECLPSALNLSAEEQNLLAKLIYKTLSTLK